MLKILCILCAFSVTSYASEDISVESLQQKLELFQAEPEARFTPKTIHLIQAYLGAAMLAQDENQPESAQKALHKTHQALLEARANAKHYQTQHAGLLQLQRNIQAIVQAVPDIDNPLQEPNPQAFIKAAESSLKQSIQAAESGQLNMSQQAANQAKKHFLQALDSFLPTLIQKTGHTLSKAAAKNAKYYTPVTYEASKKELADLIAYQAKSVSKPPEQPLKSLQLALKALELSLQVKAWRKKRASHESLWLQARSERQQLAKALGLSLKENDISTAQLIHAIDALQAQLLNTQSSNISQITELKSTHQLQLQQASKQQSQSLSSAYNQQLSQMKEAFRAKLARETFEIKRQKKIHALFNKSELSIVVNLDGSLVLRLSSLKFPTGGSKIDATYFALLSKVKQAMAIYSDRNIRIEGHTDDRGEIKANQKLSLKRAEAVRNYLAASATTSSSIKALGYGEVRPIASNDFAKGREMNRRIDLVIESLSE
ncbi:MAG: OmpA family protein [Mariprofundaceae bacterium]